MPSSVKTAVVGLTMAGLAMTTVATDASAATARHIYNKGHHGHAARYGHHRSYGNAAAGRAFAGAALGLIGAAAGAAVASRAYEDDDGYGGYPYGGPAYSYGGYGPAPYTYGGYGYGYEPF